jgi:putative transposase
MNLFNNLAEVKEITKRWLEEYNNVRPHELLNDLAPISFAKKREELLTTGRQKNSILKQY